MTQPGDGRTILVFQMGKVASLAWVDGLRAVLPRADIHHLHHLHPKALATDEERANRTGETQTVRHLKLLKMPADHSSARLPAKFSGGRWLGPQPLQIVSGVRDPVDRSISVLFFLADFYGHTKLALSYREKVSLEALAEYFTTMWRVALSGETPPTTFEAILCTYILLYGSWFDLEFKEFLHIDVESSSFDFDRRSLRIGREDLQLLCYRFEDMGEPGAWEKLAASASDFLGVTLHNLPKINAMQNRRGRELYQAFKSNFTMPQDMLDQIYSAPILKHFYSADELDRFRARWLGGPARHRQVAATG